MDPQSRYTVVNTRIAERQAEAYRARLAKGDTFEMTREITVHGRTPAFASLRERLAGLRALGARHAHGAPAAAPAR